MNKQETKKLEQKVLQVLNKHLKKGDTVITGISGGPDSVFLLHFLQKLPLKIVVAHVNHQIRKKEADLDEKFVKELAKKSNCIFELKTANVPALSQKSKKGIEEMGRKIRYDFFKKLAQKYKAKFIITAHHADDNLETIIMNFTRGAGLQGLSGMESISTLEKNVLLLRPLLEFSKKQIADYLKFHKIKFRIDKSNLAQIYKRNVIRKKIIPELKKINPSIIETIAKNSENLREANSLLKEEANKWLKKNTLNNRKTQLNARSFRHLHPAVQKTIIRKIYKNLIGSIKNLENIHIEEVLKIINQNIGNKRKKLGGLTFSVKNNVIKCCKNPQNSPL